MSKVTVKFKVESEVLVELLKELKSINTPRVKDLKGILKQRVLVPFNKPKVSKKRGRERIPTNSPEELRYRDQKYIIDYYNSITEPKYWEIAEGFRNDLKTNKATPSEIQFKAVLKAIGVKYEFQHIVFINTKGNFFILDFYLPDYNVGVEIDGGYHFTHEQYIKDEKRTRTIFKFIKIRNIIRFKNSEIKTDEAFLNKVKRILNDSGLSRVKLKEF